MPKQFHVTYVVVHFHFPFETSRNAWLISDIWVKS